MRILLELQVAGQASCKDIREGRKVYRRRRCWLRVHYSANRPPGLFQTLCTILMHFSMVGWEKAYVLGLHARHVDHSRYSNANISRKQAASPSRQHRAKTSGLHRIADDLISRYLAAEELVAAAERATTHRTLSGEHGIATWQLGCK